MMNRSAILGIFGGVLLLAAPAFAAEAAGRVVFGAGTAATPRGVKAADAVVWLVGGTASSAATGTRAVFDQKDLAFVPHVLPIQQGTVVEFRNGDAVFHNIRSRSDLNPSFNRPSLRNVKFEAIFAKSEVVGVACDVHSQMSGYIVVVPTPHFAKAGRDGAFRIANVPAGRYRLVAWHERYGQVEIGPVDVSGARTVLPDVRFAGTLRTAGAR